MTFTHPNLLKVIQAACPELMEEDCLDGAQHYCPNCGSGISLSEPQLADILRAMQRIEWPNDWIIDVGGEFWQIKETSDEGAWYMHRASIRWQLSMGLYGQNKPTLDFLEQLLVGKK